MNASLSISGTGIGTALQNMLMADEIQPGSDLSYQLCKELYIYHPLGAKMVELPIKLAQSQTRIISVQDSPDDRVARAFIEEWKRLGADRIIANVMRQSRIYGSAAVIMVSEEYAPGRAIPLSELYKLDLNFNVLDPLNTSGSLVLNQDPNAPDFLKAFQVSAANVAYHPSRSCVMFNEQPVYLAYSTSAFGYVGRSVYQRALFPLKSFIQSMVTDDLVTKKAGLLVAMIKTVGSVTDKLISAFAAVKRNLLKEAETGNVITVGENDKIESINMQNADTAMRTARKNIIENIASAANMPAMLLTHESFASGFGEGSEDAKKIASHIDGVRASMTPLYSYFERIVMHRAWNPLFFASIQAEHPEEYGGVTFEQAFYRWQGSFSASWPSLLTEPASKAIGVDDTRMKTLLSIVETFIPTVDADNAGAMVGWAQNNLNEQTNLFKHALNLDIDGFVQHRQNQLDSYAENFAPIHAEGELTASRLPGFVGGKPEHAIEQEEAREPDQKHPEQKLSSVTWSKH